MSKGTRRESVDVNCPECGKDRVRSLKEIELIYGKVEKIKRYSPHHEEMWPVVDMDDCTHICTQCKESWSKDV